jgi:hypothetical protein
MEPAPETQGLPMPRATTAAWEVMPPRVVEDALRRMHAVDVLRARLDAHQDDLVARLLGRFRILGIEHDLADAAPERPAARRPGSCAPPWVDVGWSSWSSAAGSTRPTASPA